MNRLMQVEDAKEFCQVSLITPRGDWRDSMYVKVNYSEKTSITESRHKYVVTKTNIFIDTEFKKDDVLFVVP